MFTNIFIFKFINIYFKKCRFFFLNIENNSKKCLKKFQKKCLQIFQKYFKKFPKFSKISKKNQKKFKKIVRKNVKKIFQKCDAEDFG